MSHFIVFFFSSSWENKKLRAFWFFWNVAEKEPAPREELGKQERHQKLGKVNKL